MEGDQSNQGSVETSNKPAIWPIVIVVLLLIGAGGYFFMNSRNGTAMEPNSTVAPAAQDESDTSEDVMEAEGDVQEFTLEGTKFKYDVTEIRVKEGDTVQVTLKSVEGMHDFVVDEFDARTNVLEEGDEETITFVADKAGEYEYYCSVGEGADSHRAKGMVGKLIVE